MGAHSWTAACVLIILSFISLEILAAGREIVKSQGFSNGKVLVKGNKQNIVVSGNSNKIVISLRKLSPTNRGSKNQLFIHNDMSRAQKRTYMIKCCGSNSCTDSSGTSEPRSKNSSSSIADAGNLANRTSAASATNPPASNINGSADVAADVATTTASAAAEISTPQDAPTPAEILSTAGAVAGDATTLAAAEATTILGSAANNCSTSCPNGPCNANQALLMAVASGMVPPGMGAIHTACGKQYLFALKAGQSTEAINGCCGFGKRLASMETASEISCLVDFVKTNSLTVTKYWVSGMDLGCSGDYMWCSQDSVPFDQNEKLWMTNEPTPKASTSACTALSVDEANFGLSLEACDSQQYGFICE